MRRDWDGRRLHSEEVEVYLLEPRYANDQIGYQSQDREGFHLALASLGTYLPTSFPKHLNYVMTDSDHLSVAVVLLVLPSLSLTLRICNFEGFVRESYLPSESTAWFVRDLPR